MSTYSMKAGEIAKDWLVVDAKDIPLGRLATQVATFLRGKHKPTFTPNLDMGDNVIVLNAAQVKLTGLKADKKIYIHHTGYPSGQRFTPVSKLVAAGRPEEVIMRAVKGMLPKTKLGRAQLTNLRVYADATHPHTAQQPKSITL
ncbi:MAG: 50S ribosomal protein L13 [bacterium]|nr:50S ribosomal protein L13 [bacterium]MBK7769956.1 50S ribosomal protein L13 [bacterium]MBK9473745.1 50S ribosomal protein L13 [bacterium]